MTMIRDNKRTLLGLVSVLVSAGLVVWLLARIDLAQTGELLADANWGWLLLAALLTCALPFTSVFRWLGVLRAQDTQLPFLVALRAVMMANVLNSFLPSKSGDVAKAVYLREHGGLSKGTGTVILERLVDLGVLGALGLFGLLVNGTLWGLVAGAGLLGGVLGVFLVVTLLPIEKLPLPGKVTQILQDLRGVFTRWLGNRAAIAQTLGASVLTWSLGGFTVFALAQAFGTDLGLGFAYAVFPLAILAGLVPVTVSGIGTRDAAFVALLGSQMSPEQATLVGLGYTLFAYWFLSLVSFPVVAWQVVAFLRGERPAQGELGRQS